MVERMALLVIDMQKELLRRPVLGKGALIDNINRLTAHFREARLPVFFIRHTNGSFVKEGTEGWQLDPRLDLADKDTFVNKTHSSVFQEKGFRDSLGSIGIRTVVVTGLVSNGRVQAACTDALKHDYSVILIGDGHSTFHKDAESLVPAWNKKLESLGVRVLTTNEFFADKATEQAQTD